MPLSADKSSVASVCVGRPMARFDPEPTISRVLPSDTAHCTASTTALASRGLRLRLIQLSRGRAGKGAVHNSDQTNGRLRRRAHAVTSRNKPSPTLHADYRLLVSESLEIG